jgi:CRP/FNR family cyclic AMP-dependent transcriptional regulator
VGRAEFELSLQQSPSIHEYMVQTLVQRLRQADDEAAATSFLTVKARVARALLHLARHLGEKTAHADQVAVRHHMRQADLAALAGVARESVSRTLSAWRRSGVVGRSSRSTYLINVKKLERQAFIID